MARPTVFEQRQRELRFWVLLAEGCSLAEAAAGARLEPRRVLGLLDRPDARRAALALLEREAREAA